MAENISSGSGRGWQRQRSISPRHPSPQEKSWEENTLEPTLEKCPERRAEFTTVSGYPIRRLYTASRSSRTGTPNAILG